jgi:hypothetical protein
MIETIMPYALEIASTLLVTLISVFGAYLMSKISKSKQLQNIANATEQVISAAQDTVWELKQTIVDDLKKNGKLTEEQIETLKNTLINSTIDKLSLPVLNLLRGATVDVNALIIGAGESLIAQLKI